MRRGTHGVPRVRVKHRPINPAFIPDCANSAHLLRNYPSPVHADASDFRR